MDIRFWNGPGYHVREQPRNPGHAKFCAQESVKKMVVVAKNRTIRAGVDEVWKVLTDPENELSHWTNVKDVKVLSRSGNIIEREATVGPTGFRQKTKQTVVFNPKESIKLSISGEAISGERVITVSPLGSGETRVDVAWSLKLQDVPGFVDGIVNGQISKITEEALKKIAEEAENSVRVTHA